MTKTDIAAEMNCACEQPTITSVMGVERCSACGKLAGGDAFVPFGDPLPTRDAARRKIRGPLSESAHTTTVDGT
jgi:hypothetical protein